MTLPLLPKALCLYVFGIHHILDWMTVLQSTVPQLLDCKLPEDKDCAWYNFPKGPSSWHRAHIQTFVKANIWKVELKESSFSNTAFGIPNSITVTIERMSWFAHGLDQAFSHVVVTLLSFIQFWGMLAQLGFC